jgi:hypothetical protein
MSKKAKKEKQEEKEFLKSYFPHVYIRKQNVDASSIIVRHINDIMEAAGESCEGYDQVKHVVTGKLDAEFSMRHINTNEIVCMRVRQFETVDEGEEWVKAMYNLRKLSDMNIACRIDSYCLKKIDTPELFLLFGMCIMERITDTPVLRWFEGLPKQEVDKMILLCERHEQSKLVLLHNFNVPDQLVVNVCGGMIQTFKTPKGIRSVLIPKLDFEL